MPPRRASARCHHPPPTQSTPPTAITNVIYYPSDPGDAQYLQGAARDIAALGIDNPALSAFSPTNTSKSAELNQLGLDRVTAIVTGRSPLTDLDTYIRDWRSRGGEQIRQEFQGSLNAGG